jgi:hypothetical protein
MRCLQVWLPQRTEIPHDKDPENSRRKNDPLQPIQHRELLTIRFDQHFGYHWCSVGFENRSSFAFLEKKFTAIGACSGYSIASSSVTRIVSVRRLELLLGRGENVAGAGRSRGREPETGV